MPAAATSTNTSTSTSTTATTLLATFLLFPLSPAAPLPAVPAQPISQQCRCIVVPASTPFAPTSASPASMLHLATDSCAALGPQLQAWRDAPADDAAEQAALLELWIVDKDEKVAAAATEMLWGKRPIPTAASALTAAAGLQHPDDRVAGSDAPPAATIVCRSVNVSEPPLLASLEDALYADTTVAERARLPDGQQQDSSACLRDEADCADAASETTLVNGLLDVWHRPEKHLFVLNLVIFVLIVLCVIEIRGEDPAWLRATRRARRGSPGHEKKDCYRPGLASIIEEDYGNDTQCP